MHKIWMQATECEPCIYVHFPSGKSVLIERHTLLKWITRRRSRKHRKEKSMFSHWNNVKVNNRLDACARQRCTCLYAKNWIARQRVASAIFNCKHLHCTHEGQLYLYSDGKQINIGQSCTWCAILFEFSFSQKSVVVVVAVYVKCESDECKRIFKYKKIHSHI